MAWTTCEDCKHYRGDDACGSCEAPVPHWVFWTRDPEVEWAERVNAADHSCDCFIPKEG